LTPCVHCSLKRQILYFLVISCRNAFKTDE
jgi:hypothetical protein